MALSWTLKILSGPLQGKIFPVHHHGVVIGRVGEHAGEKDSVGGAVSIEEDVRVEIVYSKVIDTFFLKILTASADVRINDLLPLARQPLNDGDQIKIGATIMVFESPTLVAEPLDEPNSKCQKREDQYKPIVVPLDSSASPVHSPATTGYSRKEVKECSRRGAEVERSHRTRSALGVLSLILAMAFFVVWKFNGQRLVSIRSSERSDESGRLPASVPSNEPIPSVVNTLLAKCETDPGFCYFTGMAYIKNNSLQAGRVFLTKSCSLQHGPGCEAIGEIYLKDAGVAQSREMAIEHLKRACELKVLSACNRLKDL